MPSGYKKDGSLSGKAFQKGHKTWNKGKSGYCSEATLQLMRENFKKTRPSWKGGRIKMNGYIAVYSPTHPFAMKYGSGYVYEHRLVVEKHLSRYLKSKERVHHINKIKDDNRIENFILFKNEGFHMWFHIKKGNYSKGIIFDGRKLKKRSGEIK